MTIGARIYGVAAIALGIPGLAYGRFAAMGQPVPAEIRGHAMLAYATAALLIAAGLAINVRRSAVAGSLALASLFAVFLLWLHLPSAFTQPLVWVSWESLAENFAMALGGLLAFTLAPGVGERRVHVALIARLLFGLCLAIFGTSEFVYAGFTASLVPAWLPPSPLFWTYLTGAAQFAAGMAVLSSVGARLAAILLTAMYLVFALIVHLPRVIANPGDAGIWGENGVNLVLAGAAWLLADSFAAARQRREQAVADPQLPPS